MPGVIREYDKMYQQKSSSKHLEIAKAKSSQLIDVYIPRRLHPEQEIHAPYSNEKRK